MEAAVPHHVHCTPDQAAVYAWHLAANHAPLAKLKHMAQLKLFPSMNAIGWDKITHITCTACYQGKLRTNTHPPARRNPCHPGQILSSDTIGPINPPSTHGHRHILTIMDLATRKLIALPMRARSETPALIAKHITQIQTTHGAPVQVFHSDNAKEYLSQQLQQFLAANGIQHTTTVPHHPENNAIAERINQTLMQATRAAIAHSKAPTHMWHHAITDVTFKYNWTPHSTTDAIPYQAWSPQSTPPPYILPFMAKGAVPDRRMKNKLSSRSRPAHFLFHISQSLIGILYADDNTTSQARLIDFYPIHPNLDPTTAMATAFKCKMHEPIPKSISSSTTPPQHTGRARYYPDASEWAIAHDQEIDQLDAQNAIRWITNDNSTPPPDRLT